LSLFIVLTSVLFIVCIILLFFLWVCRILVLRMFGSFKNFFLKNAGYGNAYIFEPGNRIQRHYVKFNRADSQIVIAERNYNVIPEKMFYDDMGINSLMYYLNDCEPMTPKEKDKSENMIRNASYWSNLANMIKMFAELKASKQIGFVILILSIVLIITLIVAGMQGYLIYELTSKTGAVMSI